MIQFPCGVCSKPVADTHRAIACDICQKWIHIKCNNFDKNDYKFFQNNSEECFICKNCISDNVAFSNLNNNEFSISVKKGIINSNDTSLDFNISNYQQQLIDRLNTAINNNAFDLDSGDEDEEHNDLFSAIDCKFYSIDEFTAVGFNTSKTFSILHYNIHSIECHIEEFQLALQMIDFKFDIICISESKIRKNIDPKVNIDILGFQPPVGTPTEATKGGVLIYVKKGINFKPRIDLNLYKSKELESYFIEIVNQKQSNDIVGVIYRHPCMSEEVFNEEYLKQLADKLSTQNKNIFIAGDFNFNLLNVSSHAETFEFFDTMMSNFLLPVITIPTKINRGHNTLIDNIFTNHLHPDTKSGNLLMNLSDGHLPSFMVMPKQNQNHLPKKHNTFCRNSKNFDGNNFINDYRDINWDDVINVAKNDVNFSLENFLSKFNVLLDKHLPNKKMTQKQFKQKYKPWISNEVIHKISDKNKILKKIVKCKDAIRKNVLSDQFKGLKNEVTHLTRTGKKTFYQKYFAENKNNLQKVWKGIKEIINVKSKNFDSPVCLQDGDATIVNPSEISNSFNDYFTTIADDILKKT